MLSLYRNQKTLRYAYSIRFIRIEIHHLHGIPPATALPCEEQQRGGQIHHQRQSGVRGKHAEAQGTEIG